jgi:hypothetical protein
VILPNARGVREKSGDTYINQQSVWEFSVTGGSAPETLQVING